MSDDAMEILRGLLERKVIHRLGSGPTGAKELIRTKFFGFYDFKRVLKKGYTPEFKPPTSFNPADAKNFDPEFTREKPVDSFVNQQMTVSLQEKADFDGFSYRQTMPEVSHVNR